MSSLSAFTPIQKSDDLCVQRSNGFVCAALLVVPFGVLVAMDLGYVNATVGFETLAQDLDKDPKSLMRMLSAKGNPYGRRRCRSFTRITDLREVGRPASYRSVAEEMRKVKGEMEHPDAKTYVTHGLRKNATIELYRAGCDDEMVRAVTGHSGAEMLKKYGGRVRQKALATRAQEARNKFEKNKNET